MELIKHHSNNSPKQVVSRLFHNGDYFERLSNYSLKYFLPKLEEHIEKCKHPKCTSFRNAGLELSSNTLQTEGNLK